jgi:glycosyltransferase involved in cell wall biosynthesis
MAVIENEGRRVRRPRIAVFDYDTVSTNPYGKGVLTLLDALADDYDFTVYSTRFENPRPDRILWRRVVAIQRPLVLLQVSFLVMSWLRFTLDRLRGRRYDVVQSLETASLVGSLLGVQFCHRAYLRDVWPHSHPVGIRRPVRWGFEWIAGRLEPLVFRRARHIVVPSIGLNDELRAMYPDLTAGFSIIPNAIDCDQMARPVAFDAPRVRSEHGFSHGRTLLVFAALGHFERKGLPIVLDALADLHDQSVDLVVVGGKPGLVASYRADVARRGLADRVRFVGEQPDVRPFLWSADAFVFPTAYEAFPYVVLEAAAAGLPLIVTPVYGVSEYVVDGVNGFLVQRDRTSVARAIAEFVALHEDARDAMGRAARRDVEQYDAASYARRWDAVYRSMLPPAP